MRFEFRLFSPAALAVLPRINRAKAEKLLADFLRSVEEVNTHPDLLHWVTEVRVLGSYLTNSDDLVEIDIAIKKERRSGSGSIGDCCLAMAERNGKSLGTDHDMGFYSERLVARLLKGGSRYISLHAVAELDENSEFGGKTIYTFEPPKRHDCGLANPLLPVSWLDGCATPNPTG